MAGVHELTPTLGTVAACRALGLSRDAPARQRRRERRDAFIGPPPPRRARQRPHLALDETENAMILETLNSERFVDTAPARSTPCCSMRAST
jgi:putative transposase